MLYRKLHRRMTPLALALGVLACAGGAMWSRADVEARTSPASTQPTTRRYHAPAGARVVEEGWFAPIKPAVPAPRLPTEITRVFVIPIHGPISSTTAEAFDRKVRLCRGKDAQIVVLDMNTPGGELGATEQIIKRLTQDFRGIYTVAYVNPDAFSAGAMISLACNEVVMSPVGKMGAAMPILVGPSGVVAIPRKEREKFESAARSMVRSLAEVNGYDPLVCEGMVGSDIGIWLIRNQRTGQLKFVRPGEWSALPGAPAASTQPAAERRQTVPETGWEYVRTVDGFNELVTATASEAVFLGLSRHTLASMAELREHYHITAEPTVLEDTWSEDLVDLLTSPVVTSILFLLMLLGAYMEFQTPGFGLAGTVAVVALAMLLGGRFLIGMAVWWEVGLLAVGVLLILAEVFITPGFGVLGITGILMCVVSLIGIIVDNPPDRLPIPETDLGWEIFASGLMALGLGLLGAMVAIIVLARYLPRLPVAGRLVLAAPPEGAATMPVESDSPMLAVQVGDVGVVMAICRPVGEVRIGDKLIDAETEGDFLQAGTKVRVVRKEGNRIVIRELKG